MLYSNMSIRTVAEPSLALRVRLSQRERFAARCFEQAPETGQERSMPVGQSIESQRYACRVSWMLSLTHSCRRSDSSLPSAVGRPQSKRGRTFEDAGDSAAARAGKTDEGNDPGSWRVYWQSFAMRVPPPLSRGRDARAQRGSEGIAGLGYDVGRARPAGLRTAPFGQGDFARVTLALPNDVRFPALPSLVLRAPEHSAAGAYLPRIPRSSCD